MRNKQTHGALEIVAVAALGALGVIVLFGLNVEVVIRAHQAGAVETQDAAHEANLSALSIVGQLLTKPVSPTDPSFPNYPYFYPANYFSASPTLAAAHSAGYNWMDNTTRPPLWTFNPNTNTFTFVTPSPAGINYDQLYAVAAGGGDTTAYRVGNGQFPTFTTTVTFNKPVRAGQQTNPLFISNYDLVATTTADTSLMNIANQPLVDAIHHKADVVYGTINFDAPPTPTCSLSAWDSSGNLLAGNDGTGATKTATVAPGTPFTVTMTVTGLVAEAELWNPDAIPNAPAAPIILAQNGTGSPSSITAGSQVLSSPQSFVATADPGGSGMMSIGGQVSGPFGNSSTCDPSILIAVQSGGCTSNCTITDAPPSGTCPYESNTTWGPITVPFRDANRFSWYYNQPQSVDISFNFTTLPPVAVEDGGSCYTTAGTPTSCLGTAPGGIWERVHTDSVIYLNGAPFPNCPTALRHTFNYCFLFFPPGPTTTTSPPFPSVLRMVGAPPYLVPAPGNARDWTPDGRAWWVGSTDPQHPAAGHLYDPRVVVGIYDDNLGSRCGLFIIGRYNGCFAPETPIRMADGSTRAAQAITGGDFVWNPVTKKAMKVKKLVVGPEAEALLEIGYGNHLIHVTENHPIATARGPLQAKELTTGDRVLGEDNQYHRLTRIRTLPIEEQQMVWNFKLDTDSKDPQDHYLLANGMVAGDATLQEELTERESFSNGDTKSQNTMAP